MDSTVKGHSSLPQGVVSSSASSRWTSAETPYSSLNAASAARVSTRKRNFPISGRLGIARLRGLALWYLSLSKLVTLPGASGAFLRLLLDQFLFSPLFIGLFLSTLVTLEGRPSQVVPKLQQEWFSAVLANWQLWIPFQFLNFRFVPQQFQVLAANVIALVWNVILSYKAHKEVLPK
ncbi:protein Mpv17-like [Camellia sinensis]|uniref:protein Mpv17-like n=1 Tax=Camellia sinensis TaxID=4442 RepID=UPI001036708C|nr:protein Mpv17-like [Camellia sinensis]